MLAVCRQLELEVHARSDRIDGERGVEGLLSNVDVVSGEIRVGMMTSRRSFGKLSNTHSCYNLACVSHATLRVNCRQTVSAATMLGCYA